MHLINRQAKYMKKKPSGNFNIPFLVIDRKTALKLYKNCLITLLATLT